MSNKLKGTLLGFLTSLLAVGLWIILYIYLDLIAGIAGALMGLAFISIYSKINPEDKGYFQFIFAGLLTLVEIVVSELICVAIICHNEGIDFSYALQVKEVSHAIIVDVLVGIFTSFLVLGYFVYLKTRKIRNQPHFRKLFNRRESTKVVEESKNDIGNLKEDNKPLNSIDTPEKNEQK